MYGALDGLRYLVVPFGLAQATFFGANVKRFLLRSVIPTSLLVPAYTFFSYRGAQDGIVVVNGARG